MAIRSKIIAVDFDGTLCENKWPEIGMPNMMLLEYLNHQRKSGVKLILWTCREGTELAEALVWCMEHGIYFDTVNKNLPEVIQEFGGDCRKIFADMYIDDKNDSSNMFRLPYVM